MRPHIRFTAMFWAIGNLVDEGKTEDIGEIQDAIANGSVFAYLERKYPSADISLLGAADRAAVASFFQSLSETIDHGRKFGIKHNGLMLLLAYAIEGIQQCVDSSHEIE